MLEARAAEQQPPAGRRVRAGPAHCGELAERSETRRAAARHLSQALSRDLPEAGYA